jgi:DNA-binding LacI/PurR family transcriptional regulator
MANEVGPGAKLPTVLQLRDRLGVSMVTVSAALDELEAQRVIRRKHGVGIFVAPRVRERNVALICDPAFFGDPNASPFWDLLTTRVRQRVEEHGESIWLHFAAGVWEHTDARTGRDLLNEGLAQDILSGRIDGVLAVGLPHAASRWVEAQGVPLVSFAGGAHNGVALEPATVVREGAAELIRQGCRRIGLWSPAHRPRPWEPNAMSGFRRRQRQAYEEVLAAHGLPLDESLIRDNKERVAASDGGRGPSSQEQGFLCVMETFGENGDSATRPDGIVFTDDMLTIGALPALNRLGLRPGRDVRIATHANVGSPVLLGWEEDLILVEVDPAELVERMVALLERLMDEHTAGILQSTAEGEGTWESVMPRLRT